MNPYELYAVTHPEFSIYWQISQLMFQFSVALSCYILLRVLFVPILIYQAQGEGVAHMFAHSPRTFAATVIKTLYTDNVFVGMIGAWMANFAWHYVIRAIVFNEQPLGLAALFVTTIGLYIAVSELLDTGRQYATAAMVKSF